MQRFTQRIYSVPLQCVARPPHTTRSAHTQVRKYFYIFSLFDARNDNYSNTSAEAVCKVVQCLDWSVISLLIFATNLLVGYYELYSHFPVFIGFCVANVLLLFCTSWITLTSVRQMFEHHSSTDEYDNDESSKREPSLWQRLLSSYHFRTSIYMVYAAGVAIAWFVGYGLSAYESIAHSPSFEGVMTLYASYSTVVLCLLHWPERLVSNHMFDIFVSLSFISTHTHTQTFRFPIFQCLIFLIDFNTGTFASNLSYWSRSGRLCSLGHVFPPCRIADSCLCNVLY